MTELDLTILAIIGRDGPLSAYDVRKVFAESVTPTWSASTGSVYPSIARLEAAALAAGSAPQGARGRKALSITEAGRAALRAWLTDIGPEIAAPTPDPVRTRMFFLMGIDAPHRAEILRAAIAATQAALAEAERIRDARPATDATDLRRLVSEGALYQLRARLEWLRWLQAELAGGRLES